MKAVRSGFIQTLKAAIRGAQKGKFYRKGRIFGLALQDADANGVTVLQIAGEFTAEAIGAVQEGDLLYWDAVNNRFTGTNNRTDPVAVAGFGASLNEGQTGTIRVYVGLFN